MRFRLFSLSLLILLLLFLPGCAAAQTESAADENRLVFDPMMATVDRIATPIYYVKGGELLAEEQEVHPYPESAFQAWRDRNGLPQDLEMLVFQAGNNGTETVEEFESSAVVTYTPGDHDDFYLTLSAGMEILFEQEPALREALERTLVVQWYLAPSYEELLEATNRPWEFHYRYE